jgi:hypothetical protein
MILARVRTGSVRLYSGYSSVMGLRNRCLNVVAKPMVNALTASYAEDIVFQFSGLFRRSLKVNFEYRNPKFETNSKFECSNVPNFIYSFAVWLQIFSLIRLILLLDLLFLNQDQHHFRYQAIVTNICFLWTLCDKS